MIIELLLQKGFVEGVDFSLENDTLTALPKIRMVDQEIEHPAVEEVLGAEGDVITPAQEAYIEVIQVEETYYEQLPSIESLKVELIKANDPAMLINEYLKGKDIAEDDSLNIELFLNGDSSGWRFANIAAPSIQEMFDLIQPVKSAMEVEAARQARMQAGKAARQVCEQVLDLVSGFNLERELSLEQITQMQAVLSSAEAALRAGRPTLAKMAIQAITPDEVLVTQEMKDDVLNLLSEY
jgi:hypothetical protein